MRVSARKRAESGLGAELPNAAYVSHNRDSAFVVGQAILPAAAFLGGFSGRRRLLVLRKSRLKACCSQDWLPHEKASFRGLILPPQR